MTPSNPKENEKEVDQIEHYLSVTGRKQPRRLDSMTQKLVSALMWMLVHEHGFNPGDIEALTGGRWRVPTIRRYTNSNNSPDLVAARRQLASALANYARSESIESTTRTGDPRNQKQTGQSVGDFLRILSERGISTAQAIEGIEKIVDLNQDGIELRDVLSFIAECKKAAPSGDWTGWGDVVKEFLWIFENDKVTHVDILYLRATMEKLTQKGINIHNLDELADMISNVKNSEVRAILAEAVDLQRLREAKRSEAQNIVKLRDEAAHETSRLDSQKRKLRKELDMMHGEIEKGTPLLREIRSLDSMGMNAEEWMQVRETVEKKYKGDFHEFLTGFQVYVGIQDIRSTKVRLEMQVKALRESALGYDEMLYVHEPLLKKGYPLNEVKLFVQHAMQVVDRLGSLGNARKAFNLITNISTLETEEQRLRQKVEKLKEKNEELLITTENHLARIESSARVFGSQLYEAYGNFVRDRTLDLVGKVESQLGETRQTIMAPDAYEEMIGAVAGVVRAHSQDYYRSWQHDALCLRYLINAAMRQSVNPNLRYTIRLGELLGEQCPVLQENDEVSIMSLIVRIHTLLSRLIKSDWTFRAQFGPQFLR
jgi:hypothetical protein